VQLSGAVSQEVLYQNAVLLWRTTLGLVGFKPHICYVKNKVRSLQYPTLRYIPLLVSILSDETVLHSSLLAMYRATLFRI
jgi:hypothetical protein